jgi:protease-4
MKDFLKNVLATIAGLFAFFFLIGFFVLMIVIIAGSFSDDEVKVEDNSILKLSLDYPIPEKTPANPLQGLDIFSLELNTPMGLNDLLLTIEEAAEDDNIEGIYLDVSTAPNGMSTLKAIRDELEQFQESGKFVVAYSEMYSQKAYYLVSVADQVYLNPKGFMDFRGFGARMLFFKGMMDKIGVSVQPFYAGQYKSAFEPFTRTEMTDANREAYQFVLEEIYAQFLQSISDSRGISSEELHRLADGLYISDARSATDYGLVDELLYEDEVMSDLREKTGKDKDDDINWLSTGKYIRFVDQEAEFEKDKIAVLYAMGNIIDGEGEEGNIASKDYAGMIRDIREDDDVAAMVLRVNSGGGSALASEIILREINLTKEYKPVIVSFGDVAASGGYYISCQSDYIFAEPNTITGSIGVFGLIPDFSELMNEKLGITYDTIQTANYAVFSGGFDKVSDREAQVIQAGIDTIYIDFLSRVYEGRKDKGLAATSDGREDLVINMSHIAEGRIWTGTQALELGLVDELGNLDDAVAFAADEAGVSKYSIVDYPKPEELDFAAQILFEAMQEEQEARIFSEYLGIDVKYLEMIKEVRTMHRYQMRMPVVMEIY